MGGRRLAQLCFLYPVSVVCIADGDLVYRSIISSMGLTGFRDTTSDLDMDFLVHTPFHVSSAMDMIRFNPNPQLDLDDSLLFECVYVGIVATVWRWLAQIVPCVHVCMWVGGCA